MPTEGTTINTDEIITAVNQVDTAVQIVQAQNVGTQMEMYNMSANIISEVQNATVRILDQTKVDYEHEDYVAGVNLFAGYSYPQNIGLFARTYRRCYD